MREVGIDMSHQSPKKVDPFLGDRFNLGVERACDGRFGTLALLIFRLWPITVLAKPALHAMSLIG
jgi:hypothetical protein